jgi:predicted nucleic acid-binding protein
MAFPAFLDTCVLFSPTLTDTLLRIADEGAFRPHWSSKVLEELQSALVNKAQISSDAARRRIGHMESAFPEATVTDYEVLISAMTCHPKDRHVLAAAAQAHCEVLVTFNLRDFPESATQPHHIGAVTPDAFLLDQLDLYPSSVGRALVSQVSEARRPPITMSQLLSRLSNAGVSEFAAEVRRRDFG